MKSKRFCATSRLGRRPLRTAGAEAGAGDRTFGGTALGRAPRAGRSRGPCTRRRCRRAGCPWARTWCGTMRRRHPRHRPTHNTPRPRRSSTRSSTRAPRPGRWRPSRCTWRRPVGCSTSAWPNRTTPRHTRWARAVSMRRPAAGPRRSAEAPRRSGTGHRRGGHHRGGHRRVGHCRVDHRRTEGAAMRRAWGGPCRSTEGTRWERRSRLHRLRDRECRRESRHTRPRPPKPTRPRDPSESRAPCGED